MKCFHCGIKLPNGGAKFVVYGVRTVLAHIECDRSALIACANELGSLNDGDAERLTDQQLIDRIAAEKMAGEWLDRLEKLPTDNQKRDAVHRLRVSFDEETSGGRL